MGISSNVEIRIHATYKFDRERKCHRCDKCFRIFTRCEKFVRIFNTWHIRNGEKTGSTALSCGQWRLMYMLIRIIAGYMCYGLAHMRAVMQFYWYLAFQLFIEIKSNKGYHVGLNGRKGKKYVRVVGFICVASGCKDHRCEAFSTNKIAFSVKHLQIYFMAWSVNRLLNMTVRCD